MTALCPKCQQIYTPTAKQAARGAARGEWICSPCCNARRRDYLARRAAAGLPPFAKPNYPVKKRAYYLQHKNDPGAKESRRVRGINERLNPDFNYKHAARNTVNRAIRRGYLVRPGSCAACGDGGPIEAHHWRGYDKEFHLDVQWLCVPCHKKADAEQKAVAGGDC